MKKKFIVLIICLITIFELNSKKIRQGRDNDNPIYYFWTDPDTKVRHNYLTEIPNCRAGTLCFDACPARVEPIMPLSNNYNPMTFDDGKTWNQNLTCSPLCSDVEKGSAPLRRWYNDEASWICSSR